MGSPTDEKSLRDLVPEPVRQLLDTHGQKAIPLIARDPALGRLAEAASQSAETSHDLHNADARSLGFLADDSIHLVVTSPPYWTLKEYDEADGQLGSVSNYDSFLDELDKVWSEVLRVLVPGGRLVVVVGDVCLSRKKHGRHVVYARRLDSDHPAPFPSELADRLVRMFSFVGDTVLDPFTGTGTTNLAARTWGRNSVGVEVCESYFEIARTRLRRSS